VSFEHDLYGNVSVGCMRMHAYRYVSNTIAPRELSADKATSLKWFSDESQVQTVVGRKYVDAAVNKNLLSQ